MSQENLELVESLVEAFKRRDFEAIVALCDPGGELVEDPACQARSRAEVALRSSDISRACTGIGSRRASSQSDLWTAPTRFLFSLGSPRTLGAGDPRWKGELT